ncbi:hypothetical protein AYO38_01125 [bacterium SCGC AG-212-C10]|nr:hypothetical protein AYO38_01125 [bacterium SCGC AG-212-C10]
MSERTAAIDDLSFLRAILNLVIPPDGRMPGAGDLDLWPVIAAPLSKNDAAFAALTSGLDAIREAALARDGSGLQGITGAAAADFAQSLADDHPQVMLSLALATSMAYYQQPAVLVALGEPARPPFPEGFELEPISPQWLSMLEGRAQRPRTQ